MRSLFVLACVCAFAAQFVNSQTISGEYDSEYGPTTSGYFENPTANYNSYRGTAGRKSKYQGGYDQYEQQSVPKGSSTRCLEKNERYPVSGSCDRYIECINGTAEEKLCPDGLRFNPNVNFNVYPCQYPIDVPCLERSALQPPQPTDQCPHQFGYYKIGDARNCSGFRNCVNGVGYDFVCPDGLAFSSETYRCEWPDQVADCDVEAFLGFKCPAIPESKELGPPAGYRYYRSSADCQTYFICIEGKPRRLGCGGYSAFDESTESCVSAEEIDACPPELKARAAQTKKEEQIRNEAEQAFEKQNRLKPSSKIGRVQYFEEYLTTNLPDLVSEIEDSQK